jgi:hypothetical protein
VDKIIIFRFRFFISRETKIKETGIIETRGIKEVYLQAIANVQKAITVGNKLMFRDKNNSVAIIKPNKVKKVGAPSLYPEVDRLKSSGTGRNQTRSQKRIALKDPNRSFTQLKQSSKVKNTKLKWIKRAGEYVLKTMNVVLNSNSMVWGTI